MFRTLRAKLAIAFAVITFVSIVGVGVGALLLLRDREVQAATQRTGDLLPPEAQTVAMLASRGVSTDHIAGYLRQRADQLNVRFIMLDSDSQVLADTDGKQTGKFTSLSAGKSGRNVPNSYQITGWKEGPVQWVVYNQRSGGVTLLGQRTVVPEQYRLLMLVPQSSLSSAWTDLMPRLLIAGGAALVLSLGVAYLVARSIARPIVGITRASEAMARGQYDQQLPVEGRDEVARLGRAFNAMASQVSGSHRMMRDLLANVAHELKTPLTSIQGFSQAISDGALQTPEEYASAARIINEESERMRRLVNDLLYLSQIESGEAALELQSVDVRDLLQGASERVRWLIGESDKTLSVDVAAGTPAIVVDARRMEQVVANLLDNAIRHTPARGTVTMRARPRADGRVEIAVHNTGSFIAPELLDRVFERFFQVDPARRRDGRNGGLGLAIAREIVLAHGGEIHAESDERTGTTFCISLRAAGPQRIVEAA